MIATTMFATPTAAVLWANPGAAPVQLRINNLTSPATVVRLAGTPTGLTASSGHQWAPVPTGPLLVQVPPYDQLAVCANPTQTLDVLANDVLG